MDPMPVIKNNGPGSSDQTGDGSSYCELFDDELRCVICSEIFVKATTLCCGHTFCKYCIEKWRQTNTECPICRTEIEYQVPTLVLDNMIDRISKTLSLAKQQQRNLIIEDRRKEQGTQKFEETSFKPFICASFQFIPPVGGINILDSVLTLPNETSMEEDCQLEWNEDDSEESSNEDYDEYCGLFSSHYYQ